MTAGLRTADVRRQRHEDRRPRRRRSGRPAARVPPRRGHVPRLGVRRAWTAQFRVLLPHHPGYGESGDIDDLRDVHDLVLHDTELFDQLGLTATSTSSGSRSAASSPPASRSSRSTGCGGSCSWPRRACACPASRSTTCSASHRGADGSAGPPARDAQPHLPADPHDVDFIVDRYRETRTTAIMLWEHPYDRVLPAGSAGSTSRRSSCGATRTACCPPALAAAWAGLLPQATVATFPDAGHLVLDESPAARDAVAAVLRLSRCAKPCCSTSGSSSSTSPGRRSRPTSGRPPRRCPIVSRSVPPRRRATTGTASPG